MCKSPTTTTPTPAFSPDPLIDAIAQHVAAAAASYDALTDDQLATFDTMVSEVLANRHGFAAEMTVRQDLAYRLGIAVGRRLAQVPAPTPTATAPIAVRKLKTVEDQDQQRHLEQLAAADTYGAEIATLGPLMHNEEAYARLYQAVDDYTQTSRCEHHDYDVREQFAYYVGASVGLRLAATRNVDVTAIVARQGTSPEQAADSDAERLG